MQVDPRGKTWNRLRASIGQPNFVDEPVITTSNGATDNAAASAIVSHL